MASKTYLARRSDAYQTLWAVLFGAERYLILTGGTYPDAFGTTTKTAYGKQRIENLLPDFLGK